MLADDVHLSHIPVILIFEGGIVVETRVNFFQPLKHSRLKLSHSHGCQLVSRWTGILVALAAATICLMGANLASCWIGFVFALAAASLCLLAANLVSWWTGVSVALAAATVCLMGANLASCWVGFTVALAAASFCLLTANLVSYWTGVSVALAAATVCLMGTNLASCWVGFTVALAAASLCFLAANHTGLVSRLLLPLPLSVSWAPTSPHAGLGLWLLLLLHPSASSIFPLIGLYPPLPLPLILPLLLVYDDQESRYSSRCWQLFRR